MSYEVNFGQYPQSWYPLCFSSKISKGAIKSISAFDNSLVVYRGHSGKLTALDRYCTHMGADLSQGKVIDDNIRCPLHHWLFNPQGIPFSKSNKACSEKTKLRSFPVIEKLGIIFIFLGENILFDFPMIDNMDETICSSPWTINLNAPYFLISLNAFDAQHFHTVHHRKIVGDIKMSSLSPYHLGSSFSAQVLKVSLIDNILWHLGFRTVEVNIHCWGNSLLIAHNEASNYFFYIALLPVKHNQTTVFIVALSNHQNTLLSKLTTRIKLNVQRAIGNRFLLLDMPILENMEYNDLNLMADKDKCVLQYIHYTNQLPKYLFKNNKIEKNPKITENIIVREPAAKKVS